jgi:hypothetical protein
MNLPRPSGAPTNGNRPGFSNPCCGRPPTRSVFFGVAWLASSILWLLAASGCALAAEPADRPGAVLEPAVVMRTSAPTVLPRLKALLQGLLATPPLANPRGMSVHPGITLTRDPVNGLVTGSVRLLLKPLGAGDVVSTRGPGEPRWIGQGEGDSIEVRFNDVAALQVEAENAAAIIHRPTTVGHWHGLPLLQVAKATPVLVIAPAGRPLWVPITLGEHLATRAGAGGPDATAAREQLAALDDAGRASPACAPHRRADPAGDCAAPDATFYVRWNQRYFDTRRRDAVQLVTVQLGHARHEQTSPAFRQAHPLSPLVQAITACEAYDWNDVARWVE